MWELCCADDGVVAGEVAAGLVNLVRVGRADYAYVLHHLVALLPAARHLSGVVHALSELMLLHVASALTSGSSYTCPYDSR